MHDQHDTAGVIAPPPLIYAGFLLLGWLLHLLVPIRFLPQIWSRVIGAMLVGSSLLITGAALRTMFRAGTNPEPHRPTTALVTEGPFRYTRNPIYLSFTLLFAGIAALINSLTMLIPLPFALLVMQRGVIEREERYLDRKFGDEYRSYKARVRRWI
jgi:protein-S-isoprenylcysteine O-methyltransferase Ste14